LVTPILSQSSHFNLYMKQFARIFFLTRKKASYILYVKFDYAVIYGVYVSDIIPNLNYIIYDEERNEIKGFKHEHMKLRGAI
jgi:hypothetical protein